MRGLHCPSQDLKETTNGSYQQTPLCSVIEEGPLKNWPRTCIWAPFSELLQPCSALKAQAIYKSPGRILAPHQRVGRGGREGRVAPSQPLLLINHQKSLPWFMAFDPGSSFTLWGRELWGEREEGTEGAVNGVRVKACGGCGGQGREIKEQRAFCFFKYESMSCINPVGLTWNT